mmetsp:Transcript_5147/g.9025  ORF Transcript_5147/g.9025 Transcript_5147/m.9025 type:complete len:83 (+) Transcript_5147:959-1207(+)
MDNKPTCSLRGLLAAHNVEDEVVARTFQNETWQVLPRCHLVTPAFAAKRLHSELRIQRSTIRLLVFNVHVENRISFLGFSGS